jgi:hypothetical protein
LDPIKPSPPVTKIFIKELIRNIDYIINVKLKKVYQLNQYPQQLQCF